MKRNKNRILNVCEREGKKEEEEDERRFTSALFQWKHFFYKMTQIVYAELFLQPLWDITEVHLRILTQHSLSDNVKKT